MMGGTKRFNTTIDLLKDAVTDFQEEATRGNCERAIGRFEKNVHRLAEMAVDAAKDLGKRKHGDEEDDFLADSDIEPEVYSDSEYDREVTRKFVSKKLPSPSLPVPYVEADDVIDLDEESSKIDETDCKQFLTMLRDKTPLKQAVKASFWFQRRYQNVISAIRDGLGIQSNNGTAQENWDTIIADAFAWSDDHFPMVENKERTKALKSKCALCGYTRKCAHTIWIRGYGYPIGTKCSALASAVIEFYSTLHRCVHEGVSSADTVRHLDELRGDIQEAHANKVRNP